VSCSAFAAFHCRFALHRRRKLTLLPRNAFLHVQRIVYSAKSSDAVRPYSLRDCTEQRTVRVLCASEMLNTVCSSTSFSRSLAKSPSSDTRTTHPRSHQSSMSAAAAPSRTPSRVICSFMSPLLPLSSLVTSLVEVHSSCSESERREGVSSGLRSGNASSQSCSSPDATHAEFGPHLVMSWCSSTADSPSTLPSTAEADHGTHVVLETRSHEHIAVYYGSTRLLISVRAH
jgi:hypothetical protein